MQANRFRARLRRRQINRARHQRKTQKTAPTRARHQKLPARPAANLQSISYRKGNQVVKQFHASPALLKTVRSRLDLQYTMVNTFDPSVMLQGIGGVRSDYSSGIAIIAMLERCASAQQAREPQPDIAAIRVAEYRRHPPQPSAPWADGTCVGFRCTRCGASPRFRPQNCGALNQTLPVTGMIPNYCDFTTDSAFKATGRRPSEGALVTSNWRGCALEASSR